MKYFFLVLSILTMVFIWSNSLKNGTESSGQSNIVTDAVVEVVENITNEPADFNLWSFLVRKAAHMTEFAVLATFLALTLYLFTKKKWFIFVSIGISFITALIDEGIQLSIEGRGGSFTDCLIDTLGATIAVVIVFLVLVVKNRNLEVEKI